MQDGLQAALVDGNIGVRIGFDKTMPWEMLAAIGHARLQQAMHQALSQQGNDARVTGKCAVANHTAGAKVQIQHRGEAEVHATGA